MKHIRLLIFLSLSAHFAVHGQQPLDTLVSKFKEYRENAYQEKIYVHLDRGFYLTGESMWFKIYTVDGAFHRPSDVSKVAYVELLDNGGVAVLQAKIKLTNGLGNGSFFLPASITSGNYMFRVYTKWMRNFPPEFYYSKTISIVNPFVSGGLVKSTVTPDFNVEFFPEGGNLVTGIKSKVAFRLSHADGIASLRKAVVLTGKGDTVATLAPDQAGLGSFFITPEDGQEYKAMLTGSSGSMRQHPFQKIQPIGYTMHVVDSGKYLKIDINSRGINDAPVFLFIHARQIIVRAQSDALNNGRTVFQVAKADLPQGVSHFTLFDHGLQPICERLYFTPPRKNLTIAVSTNQKNYLSRRKVTVSLSTSANNLPSASNLSLSVHRVDSLPAPLCHTINEYLWLGSDVPGMAPIPAYYFQSEGRKQNEIDLVMLTNGWRRFDWKNILQTRPMISFLPEVREHIITGTITRDGERMRGVFAQLGSPGKIIRAYGSWSNPKGEFNFEIKDFYGPRRIIVQKKTDSTQNYRINIDDPFSPASGERMQPLILSDTFKDALLARSIAMQVQDVYYYDAYGKRTELPLVDSSAFYGQADATYYLDDYTRFPVMEEVMREYVPGVFVRKRKDGFHFVVVDDINGGVLAGDPMVLVDGVPVQDVDDVMRMDPLRVKKLEVIKRPYYLGQSVFSGIISYTTYQGDLGGLELDPRSVTLDYDGLQLKRQFHNPEYSRDQRNNRMPDQRHLLHWEPEITTDENGQHQLEFYTSDATGRYVIVVEGIDRNGYSGTSMSYFSVTATENQ